jgi:hypothetical protein
MSKSKVDTRKKKTTKISSVELIAWAVATNAITKITMYFVKLQNERFC